MSKITALTHIYYSYSYDLFKPALLNLAPYDTAYLFSISLDCLTRKEYIERIEKDFPGSYIIETPNIGKDIGGKLALIDLYLKLKLESEYIVILHDKVSPQALNGNEWRDKLLKIINPEEIPGILNLFNTDSSTGIIANKECISTEYNAESNSFSTANDALLKSYISKYHIKTTSFDFVAGTMFWTRSSIFTDFFSKHSSLEMRANLEPGNVLDNKNGTHTHTIERFLSLLAGNYGFKIKGI